MSYRAPLLIREPELRWSIVILAAVITTIIALVAAGLHYNNQHFGGIESWKQWLNKLEEIYRPLCRI